METLKFVMTSTFYPPYHLGGDAVHVKYLAEELAGRGHEVHVLHSRDAYRLKRKGEPAPIEGSRVSVHPLESPYGKLTPLSAYAFGNSKSVMKRYLGLVDDVKPDVVHHHNISLLGHGLLRRSGVHRQLYTAHDYWLVCQRSDLMRKGAPCADPHCTACALASGRPPQFWRKGLDAGGIDCLICPSRYMADRLATLGRPTAVLPNFAPEPPAASAEPEDRGYFLYLGVMEPHKGVLELLDAFSENRERLVLVGAGSLAGEVAARIKARGLEPRVKYLGWVGDKWPHLRGAAALVIPSLWPENNPLVALEAMSVGTPVICSDMGGTPEAVRLLSEKFVIPAHRLREGLAVIERPAMTRDAVRNVFKQHFSAGAFMGRYMDIAKGGCPST